MTQRFLSTKAPGYILALYSSAFGIAIFFLATALCRGQSTAYEKLNEICTEAQKQEVPPELRPTEEQFIADKSCSPFDLYYSHEPDRFHQAEICSMAVTQMEDRVGGSLDGNLVLTMLFANGEGVPRNPPLARHFACNLFEDTPGLASFDAEAVLSAIDAGKRIDFCKGSEGYGRTPTYFCILMDQARVDAALQEESARAKEVLRPAVLDAWNKLDRARTAFFAARQGERSSGTSGIAITNMDDDEGADADWLADLKAIIDGTLPQGVLTAENFRVADRNLNAAYKAAMSNAAATCNPFNPCPDGIRTAERAWLVYRDAWVALAAVRWPSVAADKWRSWLTAARLHELEGN